MPIIQSNQTVRRVQALTGERSFTLVLPKAFIVELGIGKGDFLKVEMKNKKLVLEKAEI
jgi:hypothetical protein